MIVDVHTHAFPDFLAERAMLKLCEPLGDWKPARDGTLGTLLDSMDAAAIDCVFLANIATRPEQSAGILAWSRTIASERILPLGSVHPRSPRWAEDLEAIAAAGMVGLKLHPQYQGFVLDAEEMFPIYEKAAELGLFILFHAGYDIGFPGDESAAPVRIAQVRRRVKDLVLIAAHVGGWRAWDEVLSHLAGEDVYLDTSYMHQLSVAQLEQLLDRHGTDRLVFASDTPWLSQWDSLQFIRNLPLAESDMTLVLGENARRLCARPQAR